MAALYLTKPRNGKIICRLPYYYNTTPVIKTFNSMFKKEAKSSLVIDNDEDIMAVRSYMIDTSNAYAIQAILEMKGRWKTKGGLPVEYSLELDSWGFKALEMIPVELSAFIQERLVITGSTIMDVFMPLWEETGYCPFPKVNTCSLGVTPGENSIMPYKGHPSDAGLDISVVGMCKSIDENTALYETNISVDIPNNMWGMLVPRSSICKTGFMMSNSVGVIDNGYQGTIKVALTRVNPDAIIEFPFRCAQLILVPQVYPFIKINTGKNNGTIRGAGGYGSTN